jgi:hypothetical protein
VLICALLSPPSLASYYPPPAPSNSNPTPQYEFNLTRINGLAPLLGLDSESRTIQDSYIVVFDEVVDADDDDFNYNSDYPLDDHWTHLGQDLSQTDDEFFKMSYGYLAKVEDAALLERIRADANVSFVEVDRLIEPVGLLGYE